jgi:hypothetical protein
MTYESPVKYLPMDDSPVTRRACLTTLGAAGAVALSGCAELGNSGGDDDEPSVASPDTATGDGGSTDDTEGDSTEDSSFPSLKQTDPGFRNWIPSAEADLVTFDAAYNIAHARANRSVLPPGVYESVTAWTMFGGYLGIDFEEIEGMLGGLQLGVAYLGSFARSDVESRLADTQYEQIGTASDITYYAGFATHSARQQPNVLAVGDEGVIYGSPNADADTPGEQFVERTVPLFETARGERPRLHEESAVYEQYTDDIGWPLTVQALPPRSLDPDSPGMGSDAGQLPGVDRLDESVRSNIRVGYAKQLGDGTLVDRWWLRADPDANVTPEAVRDAYTSEEMSEAIDRRGSLAVRQRGPVVDVALQHPIEAPGGGADPVLASIAVSVESGTATLSHIGGDSVPLDRVTVQAGSEAVDPGSETLSPGDSTTVEVGSVDNVRVIYESPHGQAIVIGTTR